MDWMDYENIKKLWIETHPQATPEEYEAAIKEIARQLNI